MQIIEPFNVGKRLAELRTQLERQQLASRLTANEIAFHVRGTPMAEPFDQVSVAIDRMAFQDAIAALDQVVALVASQ